MKKQLFRGTIEALKKGPVTIDQIADFTEQPREFVIRELERWEQCGPVKNWIKHDMRQNTYIFIPKIRVLSIDQISQKIKYHYYRNKDKMDMKMDLANRRPKTYDIDYNMLDKLMGKEAKVTVIQKPKKETIKKYFDFSETYLGNNSLKKIFDFSTIEF